MSDRADSALEADRQPPGRSSAPRVRLSCDACRQRKVKCDKLSPCTSCQRLGFKCVPVERARLPRGRTRRAPERANGSDKELADRVAKLERLLKKVASEREGSSPNAEETSSSLRPSTEPSTAPSTEHNFETKMADVANWRDENNPPTMTLPHRPRPSTAFIASTFWEDIIQQTQELRSVLDDRAEVENTDYKVVSGTGESLTSAESPASTSISASPQSVKGLNIQAHTRRSLCEIYVNNVDPLFKILHRPSLQAFLLEDKPYLDYEPDHLVSNSLALAVYYAAVCTIDDSQCQLLFGTDQATISLDLQREVEASLVKMDIWTTNDLTVLQTFVISLLASRCRDQSRRVWTMLSVALRLGQALCLHMPDPPFRVTPFDQEMRRRCWQCIGLLDFAGSQDRASEPMMQVAWLEHHLPSNINDDDLWFDMEGPIQEPPQGTFTDMTLLIMASTAQFAGRGMMFGDFTEPTIQSMTLRQQSISEYQEKVCSLLKYCKPESSKIEMYAQKMALGLGGWLQLGCLRPLKRSRNFVPPPVQGDALLRLSVKLLENGMDFMKSPELACWRWFRAVFVPWHPLAVALAELCVCKDTATMAQYWPIVEGTFHESSRFIADSEHGMLWRPLEKLMAQARARKRELLGSMSPDTALPQTSQGAPPAPASIGTLSFGSSPRRMPIRTPPNATYPLDLTTPMTAAEPLNPMPMPPPSFSFEAYPNVWDSMDFHNAWLDTQGNNAWLSFDSFVGDMYNSADSIFLPQQ